MIALASLALTVFHPGYFYPAMQTRPSKKVTSAGSSSLDEGLGVESSAPAGMTQVR
jgi:hypothetical protein